MQLRSKLLLPVQLRTARRALDATRGSGAVLSAPLGTIGALRLTMCHQRRCLRSRRPRRGAATQRRLGALRAARRSRSRRASGRAREARPCARWCWSVRRLATRRAPPSPRPSARGRRERRSAWACRAGGAASRCLRTRVGAWAMRGATRRGTGGLASATDAAARRRRRRSPSRAGTTTARREPLASGLGKQPRMQRAARQGGLASPPSEPSHCPWGVDSTPTERSANILAHSSRGCLPLSILPVLPLFSPVFLINVWCIESSGALPKISYFLARR